jgi:hypothetical protein
VLHLRTWAKLHLNIHECLPDFVENKIHILPHNVKCSKSILEFAGIVCVTGRAWSFRRNGSQTDSVTKAGEVRLFNYTILVLFEIDFSFEWIGFGEPSSDSQCSGRFLSLLHKSSPFLMFTFYSLFKFYSVHQDFSTAVKFNASMNMIYLSDNTSFIR